MRKAPTETRTKRVSRTFMSSRYDCLKSPQWATLMSRPAPLRELHPVQGPESGRRSSYALDLLLPEEAVGLDHQDDDDEDEGSDFLDPLEAERALEDPVRQVLEDPHDEPAEVGSQDRVESAQDDRREDLQPEIAELNVDAVDAADQDPADLGDHRGDAPGEGEDVLHRDAHRQGDLVRERRRPHRHSGLRELEEDTEEREQDRGEPEAPEIDLTDRDPHHVHGRLGEERRLVDLNLRPPHGGDDAAKDRR